MCGAELALRNVSSLPITECNYEYGQCVSTVYLECSKPLAIFLYTITIISLTDSLLQVILLLWVSMIVYTNQVPLGVGCSKVER